MKKGYKSSKTISIIKEHLGGKSTSEIAKKYNMLKNSVIVSLRHHGVCRRALGRDIEDLVFEHLKNKGMKVKHMVGDCPFDILLESRLKIDVKSANISNNNRYYFSLHTVHNGIQKDLYENIDIFYLVIKDDPLMPIYCMPVTEVSRYQTTYSTSLEKLSKHRVIGYLNEGGEQKK